MPKDADAGWSPFLGQPGLTVSTAVVLSNRKGETFRFTDFDRLIKADAVNDFSPEFSYRRSSIRLTAGGRPDTHAIEGIISSTKIDAADLRNGVYDGADIEIFGFNWADTGIGIVRLGRGKLGNFEIRDGEYRAEFRPLSQALQTEYGDKILADCQVELGGPRCLVETEPAIWPSATPVVAQTAQDQATGNVVVPVAENARQFHCTVGGTTDGSEPSWNLAIDALTVEAGGVTWKSRYALNQSLSVTSAPDMRNFADSVFGDFPSGHFSFGFVRWLTGPNIGFSIEIDTHAGVGSPIAGGGFLLKLPAPFPISPGDTGLAIAGCDKLITTCDVTFDNAKGFRGYGLYSPGNRKIGEYPDAR